MQKSLDTKLQNILADSSCEDFILADAKDADMGFGIGAPGPNPPGSKHPFRTLDEYQDLMREVTRQGLVDIMLMSASSNEKLTITERMFDDSSVTPAARANDTTDIWLGESGSYASHPSRPFHTATIDHIQSGRLNPSDEERTRGADVSLFSMTFNNDIKRDVASLEAYREFRIEAEQKGLRHFLEVFAPNAKRKRPIEDVPRFMNDHIARSLAGVTSSARPLFLKIPYFGPESMEMLTRYDRSLIVGILGGSSGTTHDAFRLLWEAKKYGARAALFGRKINNSECQLTFIRFLRLLADGEVQPEEAVRGYHGELSKAGISPHRPLKDDLVLTSEHS